MNESSAVSDIIQRMNSRRLQTDPADTLLFEPATRGAPRARRDQARWFDASAVEPAPVRAQPTVAPTPAARRPVAQTMLERARVGLLIAATIVAGALGIYGASRIKIGDDAPAASIANTAPVATPALEATLPTPVEHGAETASAPVTDTSVQPSFAPIANVQPTVAPPVDTNAPSSQTATPTRHRAVKHKKVIAKHLKPRTKHSIVQPAAAAPAPKPVTKTSRRAVQSADSESPL